MPYQIGWFASTGGVLGGDRRFRLQGINLVATEALRRLRLRGTFVTALQGDSMTDPTNLSELAIGVGFGVDTTNPPVGDPRSNPSGTTWLMVRHSSTTVQPRSRVSPTAGWDLRMSLGHGEDQHTPLAPLTATTSIWVVTSPLPAVAAGTIEWIGTLSLDYLSIRP